jgi:hypothetical protein
MKKLFVLFSIVFFATIVLSQSSEKRLALVIGNSAYNGSSALKNPVNDANLMAKTLEELGFTIIKRTNASRAQMAQAVAEFWGKLGQYNVALLYYAGHGVQVNGVNYLIPVDATLENKDMVAFEAISVNDIASKFEEYNQNINILILDACRNSPFRSWARGGERGFKAVNPASGTIIAFATSEGSTAADGTGENGLFTEKLVKQLKQPVPIEKVFKLTRVEVEKASNGQQSPQEWSKLKGDFYFTSQAGANQIQNTEPDEVVFNPGNIEIQYGSISIDSEISGDLYLDGKKTGYISANSKGNKLNKITTGSHNIEIRGSETFKDNVTVNQNQTEYLNVKTKKQVSLNNRRSFKIQEDDFSSNFLKDDWILLKTGNAGATFSNSTICLNTSGANSIKLYSKNQKSVKDGKLVFTARLYTYEDNDYAYGPLSRGLVSGTDRNNAIEFININGHTIQTRTVSNGISTTTDYQVGASVANMYSYKIIATESKVEFYFNGNLIATHTANIPTLPLNMYFDASTFMGNVPQNIDDAKFEIM